MNRLGIICPTSPPSFESYVSNEVWCRMKFISFDRKAVFRYLSSFEGLQEKYNKKWSSKSPSRRLPAQS